MAPSEAWDEVAAEALVSCGLEYGGTRGRILAYGGSSATSSGRFMEYGGTSRIIIEYGGTKGRILEYGGTRERILEYGGSG